MLHDTFLDREDTGFQIGSTLVLQDRFLDSEYTGVTGQVSR